MKTFKTSALIICLTFVAALLQAQTVELRSVAPFSKINTGGSWDVVLQKGDKEEVKLETRGFDLKKVITEVKNNTLNVYLERGNYRNVNLTVYVTYTELVSIKSGGSGNLRTEDDLNTVDLEIAISGSGNATFKSIDASNLEVKMSGSGNMNIHGGTVGSLTVKQTGSGNFNALDLQSEEASINKSGSGKSSLTANKYLSVRSSGSGNVESRGNPGHSDVRFSGSGKLVRK